MVRSGRAKQCAGRDMTHHPITKEQRETLDRDLATIMKTLGDIAILLRGIYGEKGQPLTRAQEAQGAVQRLIWVLERQAEHPLPGDGGGPGRVREIVEADRKAGEHVVEIPGR